MPDKVDQQRHHECSNFHPKSREKFDEHNLRGLGPPNRCLAGHESPAPPDAPSPPNPPAASADRVNPNLALLLRAFGSPTGAGEAADLAAGAAAIISMFAYARSIARQAGAASGECAEEALGRVFESVARSNLITTFRPGIETLRPYVNQIIRRKLWEVVRELRHENAGSRTIEVAARCTQPDAIAATAELTEECRRLLDSADRTRRCAERPSESAASAAVRRHRQRQRDWATVRHLFPGVALRPRARLG